MIYGILSVIADILLLMHNKLLILLSLLWTSLMCVPSQAQNTFAIEDIVSDIYSQLMETGEVEYEELQEQLLTIAANPIDLNTATAEQLESLRFLNSKQIDAILAYVYNHPMEEIYELRLIAELRDYDIRNLLPFVTVKSIPDNARIPSAKEVFHYAKHELVGRIDVRNMESYATDPVATQFRYKFNYNNRVRFGLRLDRPTGVSAGGLLYGGYLQLDDFAFVKTIVAGNFQGHFGQGLVLASPFHMGKSNYVLNVGMQSEGLRSYTSLNGEAMHGVGATLAFGEIDKLLFSITPLYSVKKVNDSTRLHTFGGNITFKHNRLKVGLTALENIYSDSLRYYYEHAKYNQNYFRGDKQLVVGVNFRYNHGIVDIFGEVAAAQNRRWGWAMETGLRLTPVKDIGLILLYRYHSPSFDNTWGYAFSESSRINDENGVYLGADITKLAKWRFSAYVDLFRFSGVKYGIPYSPSLGYDAQLKADWIYSQQWNMIFKLRAREKGKKALYSFRYQFNYNDAGWTLRSQADANLVHDSLGVNTFGTDISQDIQYSFAKVPLTLQLRLQGFYALDYDNRIYNFENDVLYAYSNPFVYGSGFRWYLNMRWKIIPQLSMYLRISQTCYTKAWVVEHSLSKPTKTDIHLLFRATL